MENIVGAIYGSNTLIPNANCVLVFYDTHIIHTFNKV